ncbi:MAG: ribonuclease Y [bacterium]|nr:ribonuclease Y [bacterium]MDZ4231944.1 ribonuclease Y [Candidatus Pacearchaeota archaeon]
MITPMTGAVALLLFLVGTILGYYVRQSLATRRLGSIERKVRERTEQAQKEAESLVEKAKEEARGLLAKTEQEESERRKALLSSEELLLRRESSLDERATEFEKKEAELAKSQSQLAKGKEKLEEERGTILGKLEKVAGFSKEQAKDELMTGVEREYEQEITSRMRKLEAEGAERFERRAKEIVAYAVQKTAVSQTQEITTTMVSLPSEDLKGKIIGKEGRNIRSLERLTGCEIIVDEAPEAVVISGFDPLKRHIAKVALERLIADGRIHPARVEEEVAKAESEIDAQVKEAGEAAVYELGVVGLDPRLIQLLGRLRFRTSYGQNVLLHSIEVAYLCSALAAEIGVDVSVAKKGGLFHDIGKALDHQLEGSHVDIGVRILEKFGVEKEVVSAMKSHHEDYPYESIEAVIVQTADAISASRPGARKDTLENYLKRISELENLVTAFEGIEKAYAIQAGREIRVFVKPQEISDLEAQQLARDIAKRIEEELKYPGEIKVTLIRENRFVEVAR